MRASFDKRWLLPLGILAASALIALSIVIFEPSFVGRSSAEVAQLAASEVATADCSGPSDKDHVCYQRYRDLTFASGVEAAFAKLKDEYEKDDFVKLNCHQITHVIGYAAAELYGDLPSTYARGDPFCSSGYYHGAIQTLVVKTGAGRIAEEADALCTDLGEHRKYSAYHRNCAHGLGHGFMSIHDNELFDSLRACEALTDSWEKGHCYGGVFMQNIMAEDDPSHPSKYLREDRPLYPCTDVEDRHKNPCYLRQTAYALKTRGDDFAKVFDLCESIEADHRPACYQGLGRNAAIRSIRYSISDAAETNSTSRLCMMSEGYEARSNCVIGAVGSSIRYYQSDARARALCESFEDADLRSLCFQEAEKHSTAAFDSDWED